MKSSDDLPYKKTDRRREGRVKQIHRTPPATAGGPKIVNLPGVVTEHAQRKLMKILICIEGMLRGNI